MMTNKSRNSFMTIGSLIAVLIGFVLGLYFKKSVIEGESIIISILELAGKLWVNLMILLILPLVSSYLISVVLSMTKTRELGKLGGYSLIIHTGILLTGMIFSVFISFLIVRLIGNDLPSLSVSNDIINLDFGKPYYTSLIDFFISISSTALKVLGRIVLLILILSIVFALIVGRYFDSFSLKILDSVNLVSEMTMKWLQKFLLTLPLAVFLLTIPMVVQSGFSIVGVAGYYIIILSLMLIFFLVVIYFIVFVWGTGGVKKFSKDIFSSQIVAVSSRSSLATMPSLMHDAEYKMKIPKAITAVIIPFFVSVFRLNRVISSPFKFIFLIYVFHLNLDISTLFVFLLLQIVISFGSPGIPSGGKYINLPIYLACGIPLEAYMFLRAVDAIPDIFKTLLNVTEVMAVASIVTKNKKWELNSTIINSSS